MCAPIVIFVYDRVDHLRRTIDSLLLNALAADSDVIIYSDAAKNAASESGVNEVRNYLPGISGFRSVTIVWREINFGLAKSIIQGVTDVLKEHESIIVLEDDMLTSPHFLSFMNNALIYYASDERVISVHGYIYPVKRALPESFFLLGADCWGWATWRRGWRFFNSDASFLLSELKRKKLINQFDFNGSYPYSKMLEDFILRKNNSWAIRWYASAFLAEKLTLYPGRSLIHNIGNDSSGTHCESASDHDVALSDSPLNINGINVAHSEKGYEAFEVFFRSIRPGIARRIFKKLQRIIF